MRILGTEVAETSYEGAAGNVFEWSGRAESRYVCVANVHMLMEAHDSPEFRRIVNQADLTVPDGVPLTWAMRLKGLRHQPRVYGPELMLHLLALSEQRGVPVGLYGGGPDVLAHLKLRLQARFPSLQVAYSFSPPFRPMTPEEDAEAVEQINRSGVRILFVGLGCPKQEAWMAQHRGRVNAVMLGVGAAFDFHAGSKAQAPAWMQRAGLEWFFRFLSEPRRLWGRYLYHNPRFLVLAAADLLGLLKGRA